MNLEDGECVSWRAGSVVARDPFGNQDVEAAAADLERKMGAAFANLEQYLLKQLGALNSEGGVLKADAFNVARVTELIDRLQEETRRAGFGGLFDSQAKALRSIAQSVLDEASEHGLPEEFTKTTGQGLQLLMRAAEQDLFASEAEVARELEQVISRSVMGSVEWVDLAAAVKGRLDLTLRQAMTKTMDTLQSFHTTARTSYFGEPGEGGKGGKPLVTWWLYDGPEDERNRDWCAHFAGTRVTLEVLNKHAASYGRNHPLPPSISLGGYNCRHDLVPLFGDLEEYDVGPKDLDA